MTNQKLSMGRSLMLLAPVVAYLALFVFIHRILSSEAIWIGFLLLWYWGMVKNAGFDDLIKSVLPGSLTGVAASFLLHFLPATFGMTGSVIAGLIIVFLLLCTFMKKLDIFINGASFLFITVLSIPGLAGNVDFPDVFKSLLISGFYIGISSWLVKVVSEKRGVIGKLQ